MWLVRSVWMAMVWLCKDVCTSVGNERRGGGQALKCTTAVPENCAPSYLTVTVKKNLTF